MSTMDEILVILDGAQSYHKLPQPWEPLGDWSAFRTTGVFHPYSYGHVRAVNSTHLFMDQVNGRTGEVFDAVWVVQENHGPFLL